MYKNYLSQFKPENTKNHTEIYDEMELLSLEKKNALEPLEMNNNPKPHKNCNAILAEYLYELAPKVNEKFFTTLIIVTRLYQDYMNQHGWDIISKYKTVTAEERKKQFTNVYDSEHIPEGCNDFVQAYLPKEYPNFEMQIGVDITLHLCKWLYAKGYTHTSISPLQ